MDEEAGFIAAMLADPDDRTVLLVYADWLDERDDPRGEYLRLSATLHPNRHRLAQLRKVLDPGWVTVVESRHLRAGLRVEILGGAFLGNEAELIAISADRRTVTVRVMIWGRGVNVEVASSEVEPIET